MPLSDGESLYYCDLCNVNVKRKSQYVHRNGKTHRDKLNNQSGGYLLNKQSNPIIEKIDHYDKQNDDEQKSSSSKSLYLDQEDLDEKYMFNHFETIPRKEENINLETKEEEEESIYTSDEENMNNNDVKVFKIRDNTPYPFEKKKYKNIYENIQKKQINTNDKEEYIKNKIPSIDQNTIKHMKKFENIVFLLVNKVNHNSDDIERLKLSNNSLVGDVKSMKDEITRQHRGIVRASNEYQTGSSHTRKNKLRDIIKKSYKNATGIDNVNIMNVLRSLETVTGALKSSIERTDDRLNKLIDRMSKIELDNDISNIRMKSVESDNTGIHMDIERIEKKLNDVPTHDKIIKMMKDFLIKEGYDKCQLNKIKKDNNKDVNSTLSSNSIIRETNCILSDIESSASKKIRIKEKRKDGESISGEWEETKFNNKLNNKNNIEKVLFDKLDLGISSDKKINKKTFELDIKEWLDNVGLRKGSLTQKGIKELKLIFDKYAIMGDHVEMMEYIKKLPNKVTRGNVNLKKFETRKALLSYYK